MNSTSSAVLPSAAIGGQRRSERTTTTVVSVAHSYSHFAHLMVAPLFPWLQPAFDLSYSQLGLLMTVFFLVSGICQALSGFIVDRFGPLPVLLAAVATFVVAALVLALAPGYPMLLAGAALAGLGNAAFHPIDYSILNARISTQRLGVAYATHGIAGSLGWAIAPAFLVGIATVAGWRMAFAGAAMLALAILLMVWLFRDALKVPVAGRHDDGARAGASSAAGAAKETAAGGVPAEGSLAFLRLPAVWLSFLFFVAYAISLGGVQSFGPQAAGQLHQVPPAWAAICLTAYMLASAAGMVAGGYLVRDPGKADRVIGCAFVGAGAVALSLALLSPPAMLVPVLFALMGLCAGSAGPSRDLLVRAATPPGATGRVYGMVYSGLDIGMAGAPLVFGLMMDANRPAAVWIGIAAFQLLLIASVLKLGGAVRQRARIDDGA